MNELILLLMPVFRELPVLLALKIPDVFELAL